MNIRLYPIAVPLLLGLAACVTEYSKSEAPAALQVDGAESRVEIAFAGGSDRLAVGEAGRLDRLVLAGNIRPADRVAIAAAGPLGLAERRSAAISSTCRISSLAFSYAWSSATVNLAWLASSSASP